MKTAKQENAINKIAKEILHLDSLKEMNCDSYDFFDNGQRVDKHLGLKRSLR